jgi:hypothetical protein
MRLHKEEIGGSAYSAHHHPEHARHGESGVSHCCRGRDVGQQRRRVVNVWGRREKGGRTGGEGGQAHEQHSGAVGDGLWGAVKCKGGGVFEGGRRRLPGVS